MRGIDDFALIVTIIGGINWGFIGAFRYNLLGQLFGGDISIASRIAYGVVALCALWAVRILAVIARSRGEECESGPADGEVSDSDRV